MAQILLNLDDVHVSLAGRPILSGVSLEIQERQRIGLVGANGAGKSTLLRLIAGALPPESGSVFRAPDLTVDMLDQEPDLSDDETVWHAALGADPALLALEAELRRLEARMGDPAVYGKGETLGRLMTHHERVLARYEQQGGPGYESRVREALVRVGLTPEHWETPAGRLSGGQKKLIFLARLAVRRPRLLLLDEPDNHLDLDAKRRLEAFIRGYDGCVIIISHDRYLLDEVVGDIAELDAGRITLYKGSYSEYRNERELRRLRQQQLYAAQQKEIARIEAAIARFEQWASIVVDERHIKQARSRRRMLDKMERIDQVTEARRMRLALEGHRGSKKALQLLDLTHELPDGRVLWWGLNATLWHGERVGLVGPNGAGKSFLLRTLLDPQAREAGTVRVGPSCVTGYYAQEHDTLDYQQTPLALVRSLAPLREEAVVAFLHRFLFTYDQVRSPIGTLSGGERSRLQLACLVLRNPNLLLLDEPTNNLDIPSIEVLESTLAEFEGTVLVVSHDRYFLDSVVDRVLELRDGEMHSFDGGYSDYLEAVAA